MTIYNDFSVSRNGDIKDRVIDKPEDFISLDEILIH